MMCNISKQQQTLHMNVKLFGLHLIRLQDFPVCAHIVITNKMNTDNWCVYLGKLA